MNRIGNNVGASTCVVCRGPCTRQRLTCKACYEKGHRPYEGKTDAEIALLEAINNQPHPDYVQPKSKRRNPPRLPHERDPLIDRLATVGTEFVHVLDEPNRNRAYNLKVRAEKLGYEATQRREGGVYRIYARKLQGAA